MKRNIILCSDGTGNQGGAGADSNVFKLYKAVDIHDENHPQITYYDNGVGTSTNRYFRALSGAFGFGFEANVCDLYEELARNYIPGDQIYVFGFSRGAATVRAFTGFVDACGLLNRFDDSDNLKDEKLFCKQLEHALQAYKKAKKDSSIAQKFKQDFALKDPNYVPDGDLKIHFVGIWDTVSALGFPQNWSLAFDWVFKRAEDIANQFFPHRYYNDKLTKGIEYGYHALSIDDARKTFSPVLWEEQGQTSIVEQVWFAGAHSNVGGGYPRKGLSDEALAWMMEKANTHGLIFIDSVHDAIKSSANAQGKLMDSRDGIGMYYRYQPRYIEDLCKEKLNASVKLHESVISRVNRGTARYAPSFLPSVFDVVETVTGGKNKLIILDTNEWRNCQQEVKKWVKKRQYLYHSFVETTFLLVFISIAFWVYPPDSIAQFQLNCCDDLCSIP